MTPGGFDPFPSVTDLAVKAAEQALGAEAVHSVTLVASIDATLWKITFEKISAGAAGRDRLIIGFFWTAYLAKEEHVDHQTHVGAVCESFANAWKEAKETLAALGPGPSDGLHFVP